MKKWTDECLVKCFAGKLGNEFIKEDEDVAEVRLAFLEKNKRYKRLNISCCVHLFLASSSYHMMCLSFFLSVFLPACPIPVCLHEILSVCLPVFLSLSVCLSVCLSSCLHAYLSVCLSACLPACLPACLSLCLLYLAACLSCYIYQLVFCQYVC